MTEKEFVKKMGALEKKVVLYHKSTKFESNS